MFRKCLNSCGCLSVIPRTVLNRVPAGRECFRTEYKHTLSKNRFISYRAQFSVQRLIVKINIEDMDVDVIRRKRFDV